MQKEINKNIANDSSVFSQISFWHIYLYILCTFLCIHDGNNESSDTKLKLLCRGLTSFKYVYLVFFFHRLVRLKKSECERNSELIWGYEVNTNSYTMNTERKLSILEEAFLRFTLDLNANGISFAFIFHSIHHK